MNRALLLQRLHELNARLDMVLFAADAKLSKKEEIEAAAGVGLVGAYGVHKGIPMVAGTQRIYHGTSKENAASIRREGLRPEHGGKVGGGAHSEGSDYFREQSKGRVHVATGRMQAGEYAGVAGAQNKSLLNRFRGAVTGGKGKILKGHVPFGVFQKTFEPDPTTIPGAYRSKVGVVPSAFRRTAVLRAPKLAYIKAHPKRFLKGVGLIGAGAGGIAIGAKWGRDALSKNERRA